MLFRSSAAGYYRPPRRGARAAVRLHDRQRESPAGGGRAGRPGLPGLTPSPASGWPFQPCPLQFADKASQTSQGFLQFLAIRAFPKVVLRKPEQIQGEEGMCLLCVF